MTERNEHAQLQAGRKALQVAGISPRKRGKEREKQALRWIYNWGWSTPSTVELLVGGNRAGLAARLARNGLINKTRTESGGGHREVPAYILTLTELGIQEVERFIDDPDQLLPCDLDPYKVNQALLRHNNIAQIATAKALRNETITGYITERQMATKSEKGTKQPDVLWHQELGNQNIRLAIEVELSAKWSRDLDQFIQRCVTALLGASPRFDQIILITDSPAIERRYKEAFRHGAEYGLWERDAQRRWSMVDTEKVPLAAAERFMCKLVNR